MLFQTNEDLASSGPWCARLRCARARTSRETSPSRAIIPKMPHIIVVRANHTIAALRFSLDSTSAMCKVWHYPTNPHHLWKEDQLSLGKKTLVVLLLSLGAAAQTIVANPANGAFFDDSATLAQNYSAGVTLTVKNTTGTCTTNPARINVTVEYKIQ